LKALEDENAKLKKLLAGDTQGYCRKKNGDARR